MANPHEPRPDRALDLLAAEREIPPVDDARRARMLARMTTATGASRAPRAVAAAAIAPGLAASTPTSVVDGGVSSASLGAKIALLVKSKVVIGLVAFGAGAGTGASIHAVVSPPASPPATSTAVVSAVAAAPRPTVPRVPVPVVEAPSAEPSVSAAPSIAPPPASSSPASPSPSSVSSSASARRERALIEQARIAVLRGDKASALSALRNHAVEFPDGQHREERDTLMRRAEALP